MPQTLDSLKSHSKSTQRIVGTTRRIAESRKVAQKNGRKIMSTVFQVGKTDAWHILRRRHQSKNCLCDSGTFRIRWGERKQTSGVSYQFNSVSFAQVRADDIFPNFICTKCWLKLADFHDFYNAVDEAKSVFLRTVQKEEIPDDADIDVNTDSLESENSSSLLRDENTLLPTPDDLMDFDYVDVKPEPPRKPNETPYVSAASRVVVSHRYTVDESTSSKMDKAQLISDSLNMTCFCCGRQIRTLLDLTDHYQVEHSEERCLRVKCCDTILRLTDLLDHMEYHLHPDKFKWVS